MKESQGFPRPDRPDDLNWARFLSTHAPDSMAALANWLEAAKTRKELDRKSAEFIIIALNAYVAWPPPFIDHHVHYAFDAGSTVRELVEAVVTAGMLMGPHVLHNGLEAVERVIEDRQRSGLPTPLKKGD